MARTHIPTDAASVRLKHKASEIVREFGPAIHQLLSDLNHSNLRGKGKLGSAEVGQRSIRWTLEWRTDPVTYKMHVVIGLRDDGARAFADRVYVQKEASTPYVYEGHTPTTLMKTMASLNMDEIRRTVIGLWPQ